MLVNGEIYKVIYFDTKYEIECKEIRAFWVLHVENGWNKQAENCMKYQVFSKKLLIKIISLEPASYYRENCIKMIQMMLKQNMFNH